MEKIRLPRFECPCNDNERLLTWQAEWLEDGSENARARLWDLAIRIAERCAVGMYRSRKVKFRREDVEDVAHEGVLYVFRRYSFPYVQARHGGNVRGYYIDLYGWNYCVLKDYVSIIKNGVRHAIDYRTKADRLLDFVDADIIDALAEDGGFERDEDNGMPQEWML